MNDHTLRVIKNYFSIYYKNFNYEIRDLPKRELAFSYFEGSSMMRHLGFSSQRDLKKSLSENPPKHFYYSSAYYDNPASEDLNSTWLGADLIFDIDADHLRGSENLKKREMLEMVKKEVYKLTNILMQDFGINENKMELVFSGSRGYHIHIYDIFTDLNTFQRREIVDYITGRCLDKLNLNRNSIWNQRIKSEERILVEEIKSLFHSNPKVKEIEYQGYKFKRSRNFPSSEDINIINRLARDRAKEKYGSAIDEPVTIDIHRLIRTPMSLHGKTGFIVKVLKFSELEKFDPFVDAIPKEFTQMEVRVKVTKKFPNDFNEGNEYYQEGIQKIKIHEALYLALNDAMEFLE